MELIALLILLVVAAYALGGVLVFLFMAGYYLTIPAMLVITVLYLVVFGVKYWRAPWSGWRKSTKSEVLHIGMGVGVVFGLLWIVVFFSNWSGAGAFFQSISDFMFHK